MTGSFGDNSGSVRLVSILVVIAGVVLVFWGGRGIVAIFDEIENVGIPGEATLALDEGKKSIYYDKDNGIEPPAGLLATRVRVTGPDGDELALEASSEDISLTTPSRDLVALLDFTAARDGDYTVTVDDAGGLPPGEIAVGPRFLSAAWRSIAAIIGGAILALGGIVWFATSLSGSSSGRPVPPPAKHGRWGPGGGKRNRGKGWGGSGSGDSGRDDDIWGDAHDWSDEFEDPTESVPGRDDRWGSGRSEESDAWRHDSDADHDDGMPSPPSRF